MESDRYLYTEDVSVRYFLTNVLSVGHGDADVEVYYTNISVFEVEEEVGVGPKGRSYQKESESEESVGVAFTKVDPGD